MAIKLASSASMWRTQGAVELTMTFSSTGAGKAVLIGDKIYVEFTTALAQNSYVELSTPLDMRVVDFSTIRTGSGAAVVTVGNGSSAISSALTLAGDTHIDVATTINDAYWDFAAGDDDLRITETNTAACIAFLVITVMPIT